MPAQAYEALAYVWALPVSLRLEWLKVLATRRIERPADWIRAREPPREEKPSDCWSCGGSFGMRYWHHIFTVANGGDNGPWNVVSICHECHAAIHPWLERSEISMHMRIMLGRVFGSKVER